MFALIEPESSFDFDRITFQINCITEDPNGCIWIGANHGLFKYNIDLQKFIGPPYAHRNWLIEDIEINYLNHNLNAWIATHWGLYLNDLQSDDDARLFSVPGDDQSISNQAILEIYYDDEGLLWCAPSGMGIDVINIKESPFQQHLMQDREIADYNISACEFFEDVNDNIWIGTHTAGLMKYDQNLNLLYRYPLRFSDNTEFYGGRVKKILQDQNGNMWVGVANPKPSICIFNEETGIFNLIDTTRMHLAWRFPSLNIRDMIEDQHGNMWFGFYSGLSWIRWDEVTEYHIKTVMHKELSSSTINDLYEDRKGNVWIASRKGLYSVNPGESDSLIFTKYRCSDCDQDIRPLSVYQDSNSRIWIGTNQGLCQLNEETKHPPSPDFSS